jgi:hypothetical protein
MADYIPVKDETFLDWAKNLYAYAVAHYSLWDVPVPQSTLQTPLDGYEAAFATALNPIRGKVNAAEQDKRAMSK